jgi:aminoglycoside phosphotransferase
VQRLPQGYTNDTRLDGSTVVKRYQGSDANVRRYTERVVLSRLAGGGVPIPQVLAETSGALHMRHIAGVPGQELIQAGHTAAILRVCGQVLRQIEAVDATAVFDVVPAAAAVLVHGDYGPHNMIFDPVTFAAAAVVDWEWAHVGDPVEDLAWCEWIVRMHHPDVVDDLEHLFTGYGSRPRWSRRQAAMLAKCHFMLMRPRPAAAAAVGERRWQEHIEITGAWTE